MLKAIRSQEDREDSEITAAAVEKLEPMKLPRPHRLCGKGVRLRGAFPDGQSALMLVAARLRHVAGTKWGTRAIPGHEPDA